MNRFARWIVKHRVAVVIICLLMLIPSVLGMNATKVKYDLLYYLPEDLDTVKGQNILMEEFGKGAFSLCITEGMSETDQQALEDAIRDVPHVDTVIGYASITKGTIPSEILPDEYRNIFEKGDARLMAVFFDDTSSAEGTMEAIAQIRKIAGQQCFVSGLSAVDRYQAAGGGSGSHLRRHRRCAVLRRADADNGLHPPAVYLPAVHRREHPVEHGHELLPR